MASYSLKHFYFLTLYPHISPHTLLLFSSHILDIKKYCRVQGSTLAHFSFLLTLTSLMISFSFKYNITYNLMMPIFICSSMDVLMAHLSLPSGLGSNFTSQGGFPRPFYIKHYSYPLFCFIFLHSTFSIYHVFICY